MSSMSQHSPNCQRQMPIFAIFIVDEAPSHIVIAVSVTLLGTTLLCALLFGIFWMKIMRKKHSVFGKLLTPQEIEDFRRRRNNTIGSDQRNGENDYEYIHSGIVACYNESFEVNRDQLLIGK